MLWAFFLREPLKLTLSKVDDRRGKSTINFWGVVEEGRGRARGEAAAPD